MFTDPTGLAHKLSFPFLIFVIAVAIWRKFSKRPSVQAPLHRVLKKRAFALQWYTLFYVGLLLFAALSQLLFFRDVVYLGFLNPDQRDVNLRNMFNNANLHQVEAEYADLSHDAAFNKFKEKLEIGIPFTLINICGQAAGLIVVFICMAHSFLLLIIPSTRKAIDNEDYQHYSWHTPKRVNWLLWIIALPAMFSIEVVLANIGVWGIVNGTNPQVLDKYPTARKLQLLYIKEDLQIATLLQFSAVYAFTRLTSSLLTDTSLMRDHSNEEMSKNAKEYKRLIRNGGFLGIWLYIIAGIVRAVIVIGISFFLRIKIQYGGWSMDNPNVLLLEEVEKMIDASVGVTFAVLTILTVVNMYVMTRTTIVSEKLGDRAKGEHDANKKFIGVRLLLICSEVVPKVINVFVKGTPQLDLGEIQKIISPYEKWFMTEEQARIMKNSILSFACLLAAIMNFIFWRSLDIEQAGLLDFTDVRRARQTDDNFEDDASTQSLLS